MDMALCEYLEAYLSDTGQIYPLAKRQAQMLCGSVADVNLKIEARIILLLNLAALNRGAPRASKDFLLGPLKGEIVNRNIEAYRAENKSVNPDWSNKISNPESAVLFSELIDQITNDPQRLAPLTGPEPRNGPGNYPLLAVANSIMGFSRYWRAASLLEENLSNRLKEPLASAPGNAAGILLSVFGPDSILPENKSFHYRQAAAAALALRTKFMVLSGGPGTGKTSVVLQILRVLLRAFPEIEPDRIVLCAPTGRAKARLGESIDDGMGSLEQMGRVNERDLELKNLQRKTLHSLLSMRPDGTMKYHRGNPLPYHVIAVDEASMVDLVLFAGLLDAASPSCRIILLGDMHQLPSVEAGTVLGDLTERFNKYELFPTISEDTGNWLSSVLKGMHLDGAADNSIVLSPPAAKKAGSLTDHVMILTHSYRSSNEILDLSNHVNSGNHEAALNVIQHNNNGTIKLDYREGDKPIEEWLKEYYTEKTMKLLNLLRSADLNAISGPNNQGALDSAFNVLDESRILTLTHGGPRGRNSINAMADRQLRVMLGEVSNNRFFHGQPVILNRNLHDLDLYNGDTGMVVKSIGGGLKVIFRRGRKYSVHTLDRITDIEPAFAITVHKAQGSEFDAVLLVLPDHDSPLLTRRVIYTGLTRARKRVVILGNEALLRRSIENMGERSGGINI
jgi:exodeoxyribonuclease V alpha subunit